MRRTAVRLLSISAVPLLLLTGCGNDSKSKATTSLGDIKVSADKAGVPSLTIPKGGLTAGSTTAVQPVTKGTGPVVGAKQIAYINYLIYNGTSGKRIDGTFGKRFVPIPLADAGQLPGLVKAISGKTVGTVEKVAIPAAQGFGTTGSQQLGISPTDTIVMYLKIDSAADAVTQPTGTQATAQAGLQVAVPAGTNKEAKVTVPAGAPPKTQVTQNLITGSGLTTATGDTVLASYTGVNWTNKKVFDSSSKNAPVPFQLAPGAAIPGFVKGLTGVKVGSRVLLVLPPAQGYGAAGGPQGSGIKGTDTLIFVVDVLAIVPQPPQQPQAGAGGGGAGQPAPGGSGG